MSSDLNNLAKRTTMLSSTYKLARKFQSDLKPVFSITSALFCTLVQSIFPRNPFIVCSLRTLLKKHPGGTSRSVTLPPIGPRDLPSTFILAAQAAVIALRANSPKENSLATSKSKKVSPAVRARAKKIKVLLTDVDGVLTDGRVWLLSESDGSTKEIKGFDAHDGVGMMLLKLAGLRTGVITGRASSAVTRRAAEGGVEFVYQGVPYKIPVYEEILQKTGAKEFEVAYVGDDLPDIPLMKRVGLAVAVDNAEPEVKRAAHYVTARSGGNGAIREVAELLLKSQGRWEEMVEKARA
jgi:3-deoxy-D-manno-octulosonate 8-phosphate phosphatase (KDO 8-P phosphatase)